jgi:hypothetical protein
MNLFREQGVKDYAGAASQIPVIDFGPYFAAETGALERLAAELGNACENIGFFYALGHESTRRSLMAPLPPLAGSTRCRSTRSFN